MNPKDVRRQRRIRAPRARWPVLEGKMKASRFFNCEDKCFEMQSIEGAAKVRLLPSGKLVEIYYIVEVKMSDDEMDENSNHAHYATLRRSFAVGQTPKDFEYPVRLLTKVKAAWDKNREVEIECEGRDESAVVSELPRNGAFAARPAFSVIATSNDGVQMDGDRSDCLSLAEILRVATLPSKFLYQRVVVEAIGEDATVFVQMGNERSLLTGSDGFFSWYDDEGLLQHRFTRETIPPPSTIETKNCNSSVVSLCQHIDYHGRFRAFRDGRVRVAFADRTILQVDRDGECCSFFFPDGSVGKTTLASAPLRHRSYIYQALEFGDWAFASQEERMQHHDKRQEAQAIVARELQRISVRCGMNMRELQVATLQHIATVDHALQAAASVATSDR
ncbi:Hypothetical protein PHPALM_17026 [Phytophthora palmivora]|uniref:C5orf34-like C-terminal domain-containing protein n=1 Tax=Phytophthora palmivora TaxID=4796 RepID=A0A2P4XNA1_9STRA|nr:Hypothetical protein PHPALM_17026 [Phytophthora palmivora]